MSGCSLTAWQWNWNRKGSEGNPSFLMERKFGLSRDRGSADQSCIPGIERRLDCQGELTGQVLYDKDGTSYTAEYASLQNEAYDTNQNFPFYGSQQYASIFAEFSMPHRGENCRGYVAYEIKAKESDWWIDSWLNYTHQKTIWQYPVISAAQNRKQGGWLNERVFSTVQDALQVLPEGERENSVGLGM